MTTNSGNKCQKCQGKGFIVNYTKCTKCKGLGFTKMVIGGGGDKCPECKGSGKLIIKKDCPVCGGTGKSAKKQQRQSLCPFCGRQISTDKLICDRCKPIVYQIIPPASEKIVEFKKIYLATVVRKKDFGYFVELTKGVEGLVRDKYFKGNEKDQIYVKLRKKKDVGLEFERVILPEELELTVRKIHDTVSFQKISDVREEGSYLSLQARVESIRQIPKGPKIFKLLDETGVIEAAAFRLEIRDEIKVGDIVEVLGEFNFHQGQPQIELSDIFVVDPVYERNFRKRMNEMMDRRSEPEEIDFLVKSDTLELLKPKFRSIAKRLRRCIFEQQPIIIRHHADADGITAGVAVEFALRELWMETFGDEDQLRHIVKRNPNKPPFYDPIDSVKDLDFALSDEERFGDKIPLVLVLDTGSSEESLFSYKALKAYGVELIVVDHHYPSTIIQEVVDQHLNVYHAGGDYNICAGMLGTELARFIYPKISDNISHLPAVAAIGDRVEGSEADQYFDYAFKKEYTIEFLKDMAIAVDYLAHFLKFASGRILMEDIYGVKGKTSQQLKFVSLLAQEANSLIERQLTISEKFFVEEKLPNGIKLVWLDVENCSSRGAFPAAGKTTGSLFDKLVEKNPKEPNVTIGFGSDFMIFRSYKVKLDFPNLVSSCNKQLPWAGVDGGGHEIVGSMKFVPGANDDVRKLVTNLIAEKELTD